ncbi:MAG TPA: outer membrane beta-barrel protein [Microvirga sp.]|jgi:outer membrane immunogenic protein
MKKLLLASVAFASLATAAQAADLPRRTAPIAPAPMVQAIPVFTWTGFYVGVNAGYGFGTNEDASVFVPGVGFVSTGGNDNGGFVGGGQLGYNLQFGSFVVGLETDLQYADLGGNRRDFGFTPGAPYFGAGGGAALDYFGTVRARAGVAFDRALVYATGGFAYGGGDNNTGCFFGTTFVASCGSNDTATGWTLGAGVEYAVTNNLTVKLEGLYVNLDRGNNDLVDPATGIVYPGSNNTEFGVVRGGVNFKF